MSVSYIKTYEVAGQTYGIEDQKAPGDHFFPDDYKTGKRKRFSMWRSGCGTGQFDTLIEAEVHLQTYVTQTLNGERDRIIAALTTVIEAQKKLKDGGMKAFQLKPKGVKRHG